MYTLEQRRANKARQFAGMRRTAKWLPYVLLHSYGPGGECPVHEHDQWWLYTIDSPFWTDKPLHAHADCWCGVSAVGRVEAERLRRQGLVRRIGNRINPNTGLPTGHLITDRVPLRGIR